MISCSNVISEQEYGQFNVVTQTKCNMLILCTLSESRVQRSSLGNAKNVGKFVGKPVGMRFLPTKHESCRFRQYRKNVLNLTEIFGL